MEILVTNIIVIKNPTKEIIDYCRTQLVYKNPAYDKKRQMGFSTYKTPKYIKLYEVYDGSIYLPIGCYEDIWKIHPVEKDYIDYTTCKNIDTISDIKLRNYQEPVVEGCKKYHNGLIIMPCGTGKSCTMLHTACQLKQKTLWLCTTKDLLKQAEDYIKNFTNGTTSRISEGKCDYSGDFVFATIQTLSKIIEKGEIPQYVFGCVIGDEIQHCLISDESIMMFKTCMEYFSAHYKFGCTATLKTANGLWKCIPKIVGNIIYELKKNDSKDKLIGYYENKAVVEVPANLFQTPISINVIHTNYNIIGKDVYDRNGGTLVFTKLITDLSMDEDRNKLILNTLAGLNGYTLIISERVDQLHYLNDKIKNSICIDGKTPKKQRERMIEEFKNGKYKVLLASYSLVAEGFDVPILENLIMATPIKDERLVIQSIGRIQRPCGEKQIANVYDFVDDVSMLNRFFTKRKSIYKKEGYNIKL